MRNLKKVHAFRDVLNELLTEPEQVKIKRHIIPLEKALEESQEQKGTLRTKRVYSFEELDEKAKETARDWYRENDYFPFLESHLCNLIKENLEAKGFDILGGRASEDLKVFYSLNHCQGDGVSFEGDIERDNITYSVKQQGRYCHEYTLIVTAYNEEMEEIEPKENIIEEIREACRETEKQGYETMEYEHSEECLDPILEESGYEFTEDGKRA